MFRPIASLMLKPPSMRQILLTLAAAVLLAAAGVAGYRLSERAGMATLGDAAQHRMDLFAAAIDSIVNRYAHVPGTVPLNPEVLALLRNPEDGALQRSVNDYLERLNGHIDSIAIFVMSGEGVTLAASNWQRGDSFVGENLAFRPYFQAAMRGESARYYAIGTTRGDPGYFVSHPIRDQGQVVGAVVIKIGLQPLEEAWLPAETPALIADSNGVVIMASLPEWRLTSLAALTPLQLAEIERTRQYNRQVLGHFPVSLEAGEDSAQVVRFPAGSMANASDDLLALSRRLPDNGWRLVIFSDLRPVQARAWTDAALAAAVTACVLLVLLFLKQRRRILRQRLETQAMLQRANTELEHKVEARTADLTAANQRLRAEVAERERAEATLRSAQDELVQAAKLAVLGQLSAGITHELTQPLGALRTLSENAVEFMHRGDHATVEKNLGIIGKLVDRMGAIIGPLKSFARKSPAHPQAVDVGQSVANALFLLDQRLRRAEVTVHTLCRPGEVQAWSDPIRLEQVLVNLVANAIDAMAVSEKRVLTIGAETVSGGVLIRVADSGPGLATEDAERLFEPFYTTKPVGEGLGLGLAISRDIVRDFGGNLSARSSEGGGAEFIVDLPAPPDRKEP